VYKQVFSEEENPDYRIYYDARTGMGFTVEVRDSSGVIADFRSPENGHTRQVMMVKARQKASEMARELNGVVFIGYDPFILSLKGVR
jgi:hypothetical protein